MKLRYEKRYIPARYYPLDHIPSSCLIHTARNMPEMETVWNHDELKFYHCIACPKYTE